MVYKPRRPESWWRTPCLGLLCTQLVLKRLASDFNQTCWSQVVGLHSHSPVAAMFSCIYSHRSLILWGISVFYRTCLPTRRKETFKRRLQACSDSVPVFTSLTSFNCSHQGILFTILQVHSRFVQGMLIEFMRIPAHVGLKGNQKVDTSANQAIQEGTIDSHVPSSKAEVKTGVRGGREGGTIMTQSGDLHTV